MSRSTGVLSAVILAVVALAGCGGGEKKSGSSSGESAAAGGGAYATPKTSASKTAAASTGERATVIGKSNPTLGTILAAGPKRLTVYMFASDHGASSTCYGACASAWPPVTTTSGAKGAAGVSASKLGTITRREGVKQVTYAGHPLYYYAADHSEGDIFGQGITSFGAAWYVLSPGGKVITKP
jgi:predicted lipoprotein with Yx(FWY)xxD motif